MNKKMSDCLKLCFLLIGDVATEFGIGNTDEEVGS